MSVFSGTGHSRSKLQWSRMIYAVTISSAQMVGKVLSMKKTELMLIGHWAQCLQNRDWWRLRWMGEAFSHPLSSRGLLLSRDINPYFCFPRKTKIWFLWQISNFKCYKLIQFLCVYVTSCGSTLFRANQK